MYSTTKHNYRSLKAGIDLTNIVITVLVVIFVVLSIFKVYKPMFFFPIIFFLGSVMNVITGIRSLLDNRKVVGVAGCAIGAILFAITVFAALVYWF